MMFRLDFSKFIAQLEGISKDLTPTVSAALDTLAEIGSSNAKSSTLFKNRTGRLRKSITFTRNGEFIRKVAAPTSYAGYVEYGNRPGGTGQRIYPTRAKALRFVMNGQIVFRKWVRSHGPLPFMGNARKLVTSFLPTFIHDKLTDLVQRHNQN